MDEDKSGRSETAQYLHELILQYCDSLSNTQTTDYFRNIAEKAIINFIDSESKKSKDFLFETSTNGYNILGDLMNFPFILAEDKRKKCVDKGSDDYIAPEKAASEALDLLIELDKKIFEGQSKTEEEWQKIESLYTGISSQSSGSVSVLTQAIRLGNVKYQRRREANCL